MATPAPTQHGSRARPTVPFDGPRGLAAARTLDVLRRDPASACDALHRTWGDRIGISGVGRRYVVLADPGDAEAVLVGAQHVTRRGEAIQHARRLMGDQLPFVDGNAHDDQRRVLAPAFQPRHLAQYVPEFASSAREATLRLVSGEVFDAEQYMTRVDLTIAARALFETDDVDDARALSRAVDATSAAFPLATHPFRPLLERLPLGPARSLRAGRTTLDAATARLLDGLRGAAPAETDAAPRVWRLLMDAYATRNEPLLRDEARGMLLGGHETAARTFAWLLWLIAGDDALQDALAVEVASVCGDRAVTADDIGGLRLAERCVRESLRLYPAGPVHSRELLEDVTLPDGVGLGAGMQVLISAWTMQRDARWWCDPETFDPGRWEQDDPARPRWAYLPWGGGKRLCLGAAYAMLLGTTLVAETMRDWRLERHGDGTPRAVQRFTLRSADGLPLVAQRRTQP